MNVIVLGLVLLAAGAAAWWWWPSRAARSPTGRPAPARQGVGPSPAPAPEVAVPALLVAYRPTGLNDLTADRQLALADTLRRILRLPPTLQQLTSPSWPRAASRPRGWPVLAAVNAPF